MACAFYVHRFTIIRELYYAKIMLHGAKFLILVFEL